MAGLGEAYSNVSALVLAIEVTLKIRESKMVTEEAVYWLLPTGITNVP